MALNPFQAYGDSFSTGPESSKTFGIPDCAILIAVDVLRLVPSSTLALMTDKYNKGINSARAKVAEIKSDMLRWIGIRIDERNGQPILGMDPGADGLGNFINTALGDFAEAKGVMDGLAAELGIAQDQVDALKDCIDLIADGVKKENGIASPGGLGTNSSSEIEVTPDEAMRNVFEQQIAAAESFIEEARQTIANINVVLKERRQGITSEPTVTQVDDGFEEDDAIFRLTYGPPKSTRGSFILSVDGFYYDSRTTEYEDETTIPSILDLEVIPDAEKWKLDHAPNLGGRGTAFSIRQLNEYVDTIFDIERIDDSEALKLYYEKDHLLEILSGQRNLAVTRVDSQLVDVKNTYGVNSAIYINMQQQVYSEIELYDVKIRKRKKQIELAVKAPDLFGSDSYFAPGEVPINDFSFLANINLSVELEKQKNLVIDQGDVSGIVLPIKPTYVTGKEESSTAIISPLLLTSEKTGAIGTDDVDAQVGGPTKVLTLNDPVVKEGLLAIYTFLKADRVANGSTKFNVGNCTGDSRQNAQLVSPDGATAFPLGLGIPRLTGIVKYEKDQYNANNNTDATFLTTKGYGTYLRLPPSQQMQDLMYNPSGCSFDFWIHMPGLGDSNNLWSQQLNGTSKERGNDLTLNYNDASWIDSNYYRLILANENTGGNPSNNDPDSLKNDETSDVVKGMIMGFTRDPAMYASDYQVFNDDFSLTSVEAAGGYSTNTYFVIAPTQSYSASGASFIRSDDCNPESTALKGLVININEGANGVSFIQSRDRFIHVNVSFDVLGDEISVYIDGNKVPTGRVNGEIVTSFSMSEVFGTKPQQPIRIPTFKKTGQNASFEYGTSIPLEENYYFKDGPKNDNFFTPWIVGGGWTDGISIDRLTAITEPVEVAGTFPGIDDLQGGFMGGGKGIYSGLGGYIGSLKIYSRPLTNTEVLTNFSANEDFFTRIDLG